MNQLPGNVKVVLVDNDGAQSIAKMFDQIKNYFEMIDESLFRELLTYTTMLTQKDKQSTVALFENGTICCYPNRAYESVKELLVV